MLITGVKGEQSNVTINFLDLTPVQRDEEECDMLPKDRRLKN